MMNKIKTLLIATLISISGVASAQLKYYGTYELHDEENIVTENNKQKSSFVLGGKNSQGFDVSGKFDYGHQSDTGIELRIRKNWMNAINSITPWIGVRGGEAITKDDNWIYYVVESGLKFPLVSNLSADIGYRYRNATEQWRAFETHRGHAMLSYAITNQDSIGLRYSRSYGDSETNAWRLSYTRSF
jgi:opacity protein-like surface antigen